MGFHSGHRSRVCAARSWVGTGARSCIPIGIPAPQPFLWGPSDTPPSSRSAAPHSARARAAPRSRPRGGALSGAGRWGALGAGRRVGEARPARPSRVDPQPGPPHFLPRREGGRRHSAGQLSPAPAAPSGGRLGDAPSARGAASLGPPSGARGPAAGSLLSLPLPEPRRPCPPPAPGSPCALRNSGHPGRDSAGAPGSREKCPA